MNDHLIALADAIAANRPSDVLEAVDLMAEVYPAGNLHAAEETGDHFALTFTLPGGELAELRVTLDGRSPTAWSVRAGDGSFRPV